MVVDLGYGASPVTAVELHDRLRRVRPDVEVVGIEIDSLSWRLRGLERPAVVAERLPKVHIHRNVPGEGVHRLLDGPSRWRLGELTLGWDAVAPHQGP